MGDISPLQRKKLFNDVRAFYVKAAEEAVQKLPWFDNNDTVKSARFMNFFEGQGACLEVCGVPADGGHQISEDVWESAIVKETENEDRNLYRMDTLWGFLPGVKLCGGQLTFQKLSKVAQFVLVIAHSNAGDERVFSMVWKNKTGFRSSLSLTGIISSLLTVKMRHPESVQSCFKWAPKRSYLKQRV